MVDDESRQQTPAKYDKTACEACGEHGARPRFGLMLCEACEEEGV